MGMSVHRIIEQMRKVDSKNRRKTVIIKKWLMMTLIENITNIHF
jgi:hypothetical protein